MEGWADSLSHAVAIPSEPGNDCVAPRTDAGFAEELATNAAFSAVFVYRNAVEHLVLPTLSFEDITSVSRLPGLVLLAVLSSGCPRQALYPDGSQPLIDNVSTLPPGDDIALAKLRDSLRFEIPRREAQWRAHAISNYRLTVRVFTYFPAPLLEIVTVRGDSVIARNKAGQLLGQTEPHWPTITISQLFTDLHRAISDTGFTFSTHFHPTYGFPTHLNHTDRETGHLGYLAIVEAFEILNNTLPSRHPRQN